VITGGFGPALKLGLGLQHHAVLVELVKMVETWRWPKAS
jgi:hypothetical protein